MVWLDQAFAHCPIFLTAGFKKKLGPCLSPNVVDHSYKSTKDRRLDRCLPYPIPNLLQASPLAILIFDYSKKTEEVNVHEISDLEACYDRQTPGLCG